MNRRVLFQSVTAWATRDWQAAMPSTLYAAAVITLAVFFVGLILCRPASAVRRVTAQVEMPCSVSQIPDLTTTTATSATWCLTEATRQQIADAIRAANAAMKRGGRAEVLEVSEQQIWQMHRGLTITILESAPKSTRLQITYAASGTGEGTDSDWCATFLDHLVRSRLTIAVDRSDDGFVLAQQLRSKRWQLERMRHYERKARFDLEDCINALVEGVADGTMLAGGGIEGEGSSDRVEPLSGSALPTFNPDWERLQEEFAQLTVELDELLRSVTANHPRVRHVTLQMDEVRRQLELTPQWVGGKSSGDVSSTPVSLASAVSSGEGSSGVLEGTSPTEATGYQQAKQSYDDAIHEREKAEEELGAAIARQLSVARDGALLLGRVLESARMDERAGGLPSRGQVLGIGLVALLCGAGASWQGREGRLRRIGSVARLQQVVLVPVIGQISMDTAPGLLRRLRWARVAVRWGTRVAEGVLGLMVLLFLTGLVTGSSVAGELLNNPLAALLDVIHRVVMGRG